MADDQLHDKPREPTDADAMHDMAAMKDALNDDMGRKLPEEVRTAVYWLNASGRSLVADQLAIWASSLIRSAVEPREWQALIEAAREEGKIAGRNGALRDQLSVSSAVQLPIHPLVDAARWILTDAAMNPYNRGAYPGRPDGCEAELWFSPMQGPCHVCVCGADSSEEERCKAHRAESAIRTDSSAQTG